MITMEDYAKSTTYSNPLKILGIGLVKIEMNNSEKKNKIIFQKGIGDPLIQNLLEIYKAEIFRKKQGNSIIPLDDYTIYLHYFEDNLGNISITIYMDQKENSINYSKLYLISKKINKALNSNICTEEIIELCNNIIEVPRSEGIIAIFILGSSGSPYFSKMNTERNFIADSEVHISAFISALYSFSEQIIDQDTGANLKEINFGNQRFYMIIKENVIFAYLVQDLDPLLKRYMYLVVDEFLAEFSSHLKNFNGDVTPFDNFEKKINQYFII